MGPAAATGLARRPLLLALLAAGLARPAGAQYRSQPWPPDREVPPLAATDLDGHAWDLAALRGRPVLLNFWATWCAPCVQELPTLQALAAQVPELVVLAVNVRERAPGVRRWLAAAGLELTVLPDPFGHITRAWDISVFPTTVLVDATGQPVRLVHGALDWTDTAAKRWVYALIPQ